jgi:hypothetical protein
MEILKNIRNELLILSVIPEIIYHICRYEIDKNYECGDEMFSKYAKWVTKEINDEK